MLLRRARAIAPVLALVLAACGEETPVGVTGTIALRSPAFAPMAAIPKKHARRPEGENVSPPLSWSQVPEGAKELVVFVDDPDAEAGTWTHWVVYGIPPTATELPEGVPAEPAVLAAPVGAVQGRSSGGEVGWTGPGPSAKAHNYQFWVYALDSRLSLPAGATRAEVQKAIQGHVLGNGRFVAKYGG